MSYTTLVGIWLKDNTFNSYEEYHNSHGSAPYIWDTIMENYLPHIEHYMYGHDELWPKYRDTDIPRHHRAVLLMTYDRAYIKAENYRQAVIDIRHFLSDFPPPENRVCHWAEIADHIELLIASVNDPYEAVGLWCTSVGENPFEGEWVPYEEDGDDGDWELVSRDQMFEIYEELDSIDEEK